MVNLSLTPTLTLTLTRTQATLMRNLREPNFNTFLAGLGVCAMVLQQLLTFDVMNLRYRLRGLVGADAPDFLHRLQNVGPLLTLTLALTLALALALGLALALTL